MCPYPTYGRRCLDGKCTCPKEYCNANTGCGTRKNSLNKHILFPRKVERGLYLLTFVEKDLNFEAYIFGFFLEVMYG